MTEPTVAQDPTGLRGETVMPDEIPGPKPGETGAPTNERREWEAEQKEKQAAFDALLEQLDNVVRWPFNAYADRGPHWPLDDTEARTLAVASLPVVNKHAKQWMARYGPEFILLVAAIAVIGPRLTEDARLAAKPAEPPEDSSGGKKAAKKKAVKKKAAKKRGGR